LLPSVHKSGWWRILLCLFTLGCLAGVAGAVPILPDEFSGNITLAGNPAPAGAVITAYIGDEERGNITVNPAGIYGGQGTFDMRLLVEGNETDVGRNISFRVNGIEAAQIVAFEGGKSIKLNLTAEDVRGDFNGNGEVDIGDVAMVAYMVVGKTPHDLRADFNGNGIVDIGDASKIAYFFVKKIDSL